MRNQSILIIDDEASIRQSLCGALKDEGFETAAAGSAQEGVDWIRSHRPDVVLLDIWMPQKDGIETLQAIKAEWPEQVVIMISGHSNIETAVRATKLGAFDFIEKPLSLERLLVLLNHVAGVQELTRENRALRQQIQKQKVLIGHSAGMLHIQALIRRVAPTTGSVLITGENGTGKDLVAQSLHAFSSRYHKPFVEVNCAAIPEELIESELFGHEKGAFTGATQLRRGKFDLAHGGTLFLDEIGDMSLKTQAKILRILQEQKFERVGGSATISVDVRIVAATNKDLKSEIQGGGFREDLFYRLNVIPIHVLPLRERKEDIPLLARHFLKEFALIHGRPVRDLSPQALPVLLGYLWPGNVRELKNLIERLVILTLESEEGSALTPAQLLAHLQDQGRPESPPVISGLLPSSSAAVVKPVLAASLGSLPLDGEAQDVGGWQNLKEARQAFEKEYILKVLQTQGWNISKTAQILKVERSHLHRKIKSYQIAAPLF